MATVRMHGKATLSVFRARRPALDASLTLLRSAGELGVAEGVTGQHGCLLPHPDAIH